MNIVLTGFMASGKTETGKAIAASSDYKFIDTDDMIVEAVKMSINEIFALYGESRFREMERECIKKVSAMDGMVIATGGGVVLDKRNMEELRKNGVIVNLAPDFSVIEQRLAAARAARPLLHDQEAEAVRKRFNDRLPFYADCDHSIRIANDKSPADYAAQILALTDLS